MFSRREIFSILIKLRKKYSIILLPTFIYLKLNLMDLKKKILKPKFFLIKDFIVNYVFFSTFFYLHWLFIFSNNSFTFLNVSWFNLELILNLSFF